MLLLDLTGQGLASVNYDVEKRFLCQVRHQGYLASREP
jgi:hypothetical protein